MEEGGVRIMTALASVLEASKQIYLTELMSPQPNVQNLLIRSERQQENDLFWKRKDEI